MSWRDHRVVLHYDGHGFTDPNRTLKAALDVIRERRKAIA